MKLSDIAHRYWKELIQPGDTIIDATLGNGKDTLFLAKTLKGKGKIYTFDIQESAIEKSRALLEKELTVEERSVIDFRHASHTHFGDIRKAKLIVYNLGYLPGGDKSITTRSDSTEMSLKSALPLIEKGGAISITAYVGHAEGKEEEERVRSFIEKLPTDEWSVLQHFWLNKKEAPLLFLIFREHGVAAL